jgi:hypothetical protein
MALEAERAGSNAGRRQETVNRPVSDSLFLNRLAAIPTDNPQKHGVRTFFRTLDIRTFNSIGRSRDSMRQWSSTAADIWATHPDVLSIGRVVFFGTPFLHKKWTFNHNRLWNVAERFSRVTQVIAGSIAYIYLVSVIVATPAVGMNAWNIYTWPWWIVFVSAFMAMVVIPDVPRAISARRYFDTNVYFDLASSTLRRITAAMSRDNRRIPSLVVSADLLDEAILGMSVQPVIEGAFKPRLQRILGMIPEPRSEDGQAGDGNLLQRGVDHDVDRGAIFILLVRAAFFFPKFLLTKMVLWPAWKYIAAPVVDWSTRNTVRRVADAAAFGLPSGALRYAHVAAGTRIALDEVFDEGDVWDVTAESLRLQPFRNVERELNRFAFLLPGSQLPPPDTKDHFLYLSLSEQRARSRQSSPRDEERMLKTALVIDERLREATGAIDLVHSSYYGSRTVIEGTAAFLVSGIRPRIPQS